PPDEARGRLVLTADDRERPVPRQRRQLGTAPARRWARRGEARPGKRPPSELRSRLCGGKLRRRADQVPLGGPPHGRRLAAVPRGGGQRNASSGLQCAPGQNGGSTDQGVSSTGIQMATTVVDSGIGASFLRDVRFAMEAVRNHVNQSGGVCGRRLNIQYVDDGWDAQRGAQYLRNFIHQGIFAVPVCPSSEGCSVVIDSGDFDQARIPVIGTDGLRIDQYAKGNGQVEPWVWPIATSTVSSALIMADWAYKQVASKFSVVFDKNYRFGAEAAV